MNWRLKEGSGEAIYEIGVSDDGLLCGLSQVDLDSSLQTLSKMADRWELCRRDKKPTVVWWRVSLASRDSVCTIRCMTVCCWLPKRMKVCTH